MKTLDKAIRNCHVSDANINVDYSSSDFVERVKSYKKEIMQVKTQSELTNKLSEAARYINKYVANWQKQSKKITESIYKVDNEISKTISDYKMQVSKAEHRFLDK